MPISFMPFAKIEIEAKKSSQARNLRAYLIYFEYFRAA
jgi:hypothetical protein